MNERKTLIDLLDNFPVQMEWHDNAELANYLISNGVEIPVRCKDCKHRADALDCGNFLCNRKMIGMVRPNDFCSFGEREDK